MLPDETTIFEIRLKGLEAHIEKGRHVMGGWRSVRSGGG
jgi:hypothetical protein